MIVELGHFALALALVVAFAQGVLPLWAPHRGSTDCTSASTRASTSAK